MRLIRRCIDRSRVIDRDAVQLLLVGFAFSSARDWDDETCRQAWQAVEPHVLPRWVAALPGTRPKAWWSYSAPEAMRKQTAGPAIKLGDCPLLYGLPARWPPCTVAMQFEEELDYLARLQLLQPGEQQRLAELTAEIAARAEQDKHLLVNNALNGVWERHRRDAIDSILDLFPTE